MHSYLTDDLPGTGGLVKESPDDFIVSEIPAYEPCGSGEHLYLTIEKRGLTTLEAIRKIAKELNVPERDIGYAGMKDSVGITRQTISVQKVSPEEIMSRDFDGLRVISAIRHTNKLKLGHLKGNRFSITVRNVSDGAVVIATDVMDILARRGVPNWFGYQRYGVQGTSHLIGAAMLRRNWKSAVDLLMGSPEAVRDEQWRSAISAYASGNIAEALRLMPRHCRSERDVLQRLATRPDAWEKAFAAVHPRLKKLYLSAYQASLFDRVVSLRLMEIDRLLPGDLAWKHVNGACFLVEDATLEMPRAATFEVSASGPMFGTKMKMPAGDVRILEEQIREEESLSLQAFDFGGGLRVEGERRPLRVPLGEHHLCQDGSVLKLEFSLPKGSYATSVVREITKTF